MDKIEILCTVIGTGITIIMAILSGVWFIVRKAQKMAVDDFRLNNMENDVSDLKTNMSNMKEDVSYLKSDVSNLKSDVSNLKEDVSNLKKNVSLLKTDILEVKSDVSTIKAVLIQKFPNAAIIMSMKKSPRILNETGKWVFNEVNGEDFLQNNKDFFFSKIDAMKPQTALDVESAANYACAGYTDNSIFNDIKMFVYNAPAIKIKDEEGKERSYELTLGDVCFALSIPLRDMYLKEHPEIPQ